MHREILGTHRDEWVERRGPHYLVAGAERQWERWIEGQGAGGQSQEKWETPSQGTLCSLSEGAEQGRGMEERSDTDLGVGVGGAWLGGGVKFGGKKHDSWH